MRFREVWRGFGRGRDGVWEGGDQLWVPVPGTRPPPPPNRCLPAPFGLAPPDAQLIRFCTLLQSLELPTLARAFSSCQGSWLARACILPQAFLNLPQSMGCFQQGGCSQYGKLDVLAFPSICSTERERLIEFSGIRHLSKPDHADHVPCAFNSGAHSLEFRETR